RALAKRPQGLRIIDGGHRILWVGAVALAPGIRQAVRVAILLGGGHREGGGRFQNALVGAAGACTHEQGSKRKASQSPHGLFLVQKPRPIHRAGSLRDRSSDASNKALTLTAG